MALRRQISGYGVGQGEIDIIASEQDVFTYRDALQLEFACLFGNSYKSEIGGAAADIDHRDEIAFVDALSPIGMALDPCIESGLWLFQHGEVFITRRFSGFSGQLTGDGVEGCGNGDEDVLLIEGSVGMCEIPCGPQVLQVFGGCGDG